MRTKVSPLSIKTFVTALKDFRSGHVDYEVLAAQVDRILAVERVSAASLLEALEQQNQAQSLPADVYQALRDRIADWPEDPTVQTGVSAGSKSGAPLVGVGDILQGRFSLVALIGEGGMSRVFKAIDLRRAEAGAADPYVAVKVLSEPIGEYFGSITALQREAHKLQSLAHPHIVRVIDCDRDGQTVFMTMEYLAGESLQKFLRSATRPPLAPAAALACVVAIGEALEFAHRNHIVHGDLKPGNVIVLDDGGIKVIDFGMARFLPRADNRLPMENFNPTTPKAITPRYASPQLVAGEAPQPSDDVYALACVAYEVLSGKHPFGRRRVGDADSRTQLPRPPGMPQHQYHALVNALAFDRNRRTPSIRRFLDDLSGARRRRFAQGLAIAGVAVVAAVGVAALWLDRRAPATAVETGAVTRDCPICPQMTLLPGGRFQQGDAALKPNAQPFALPQHEVTIARGLAMSSNDVTVDEFRQFAAATRRDMMGCTTYDGRWTYRPEADWDSPGFAQTEQHPVTCVSWNDAQAYAAWLGAQSGHAYRLPSSSEWEYAARAGAANDEPWGSNPATACVYANVADQTALQRYPGWEVFPCLDRFVYTAPVGSFASNQFGLHDLLGNVFEWVEDCWYDDYRDAPADGSARTSAGCIEHEMRGGSWFTNPQYVSVTYRNRFPADYRSSSVGFRLVRDVDK
ncbi:MAG: bifunctional serine/threonine-protein kinase/formylglycine-generating enzyme family protein [Pseudomonadota bacterium]|nr:bifunctional serine/threonine-protein kinase/formylglycine-generating enzyme family protein [Pseudomonadota bacterium]